MTDLQRFFSGFISRKGIALTYDAVLAIALFLLVYVFVSTYSVEGSKNPFSQLELKRNFDGMINVLGREGVFQSMNFNDINSALTSSVSPRFDFKLSVKEFNYLGASFVLSNELNFGNISVDLNSVNHIKGSESFLSYNNSEIDKFYRVEYRSWFRNE